MLGVEGGASILDDDGSIQKCVFQYMAKHPNSAFSEVEKICFKGKDGTFQYFMITPRHFEACMAKTCQILLEGNYSGILKPGKHYLELKKDFSNLDDVLHKVSIDSQRQGIVDQAYKDIVMSGKYTYDKFVRLVLQKSFGNGYKWRAITSSDRRIYKRNKKRERIIWTIIPIKSFFIMTIIKVLPKRLFYRMVGAFS